MIARISRRNFCGEARVTAKASRPRSARRHASAWRALPRSPADGGWSFAAHPDLGAAAAPAIWRPDACALVAIAEPAACGFAAARAAELIAAAPAAAELLLHGDWHLVLADRGRRYRLWLRCAANERLAYASPADRGGAFRLAVAAALQARTPGGGPRYLAIGNPGPSERWRLVQLLRLLDAGADGASLRELAAAVLGDEINALSAPDWDQSSERRRIARWQRAAVSLRDGGYRELLMP
jgi:hypothetical protein